MFHDRGLFLSKGIIQAAGPIKTRLMYLIREKGNGITYPDPLRPKVVYIVVSLNSTCPQDYIALAATDTETFHQCSISSDWTTSNVIKHFARVEEDSPANESSLSINRKYVVREEWVEECIAKKRLIDEREGFGGWEVKVTFDPSLASGPSRASKISLPTVSAAASAPPSLLARIGSPSVSTPQDEETSRDAFDSNNLLSRIGSPVTSKTEAETFPSSPGSSHPSLPAVDSLSSPVYPARPGRAKLGQAIQGGHLGHPSAIPTREKEKDQIEVDRNDTQTRKIESTDKGKGKEHLGETQGAGLFTVAGAVPLSFWVYAVRSVRGQEWRVVVSEEWISDCVEKGKLLDVKRYLLEVPPSEEDEVAGVLEDIGMEEEEENGGEEETGHSDPREGDSDGRGGAREASGVEEAINPKEKSAVKKPESSSGGW
ncbi:hypothetical protein L804_03412 [Cryptococcus deuterogattii 2001/935-1]|nr:hypothetical protein L804_03412 [Cryptococcus deuterogattii 2001/935-1]